MARGPAHGHAGVAPRCDVLRRLAEPFRIDTDAGNKTQLIVDDHQLAMIARQPAERPVEVRRIVDARETAGGDQRFPERCARTAEAAEPIVDHENLHAALCRFDECAAEFAADFVVAEDVVLEHDAARGAADRDEPRIEILTRIDQQLDRVAFDQRRAARAAERALDELRRRDSFVEARASAVCAMATV